MGWLMGIREGGGAGVSRRPPQMSVATPMVANVMMLLGNHELTRSQSIIRYVRKADRFALIAKTAHDSVVNIGYIHSLRLGSPCAKPMSAFQLSPLHCRVPLLRQCLHDQA
jgi:hypothetical protein